MVSIEVVLGKYSQNFTFSYFIYSLDLPMAIVQLSNM